MSEPARNSDINSLWDPFQSRIVTLLQNMKNLCFDPIIYEAKRSEKRQKWLYGVGRTHSLKRKPITWTLKSRHLVGKAVDIVSKKKLWSHPEFFAALRREAEKIDGLEVLDAEQCHVQWKG